MAGAEIAGGARGVAGGVSVSIAGLDETRRALQGFEDDLHRGPELRAADQAVARELAQLLKQAASSSGVPVAPRVAQSVRVRGGEWPSVEIGGTMRVGAHGAIAAVLLWGSEHGPRGEPNHFAVAPRGSGYWIAPTVKAYKLGPGKQAYEKAVGAAKTRQGFK